MQVAQQSKSSMTSRGAPIRVLHLGYGGRGGGVGQIITDLASEMANQFQCSVVFYGVFTAFAGYVQQLKSSGVLCYDVPKVPGLDPRGLRRIADIVSRERPDVIISYGPSTGIYRLILRLKTGLQPKWILVDQDGHYSDTRTLTYRIKYRIGAAFADCIVFPSADTLKLVSQLYRSAVRGKRRIVIHNGSDLRTCPAGRLQTDNVPTLTMVGQFSERKDQATLLRAFAIVLKHADARLWLVGDGLEEALKGLASDLGVEPAVTFWGFQNTTQVQEILSRTTVYCFSSRCESFGIAVLEAMVAGLPIVACDVEGIRTLIQHGRSGLLAPPHNPAALAKLILGCLEDPALRVKLGQAARARAIAEFSIERCAAAYGDLVMQLVQPNVRRLTG